jgi:hypothetical protein
MSNLLLDAFGGGKRKVAPSKQYSVKTDVVTEPKIVVTQQLHQTKMQTSLLGLRPAGFLDNLTYLIFGY